MSISSTSSSPAELLLGKTLDGGLRVVEKVPLSPKGTGGVFSVGYIVEAPDGTSSLLIALDLSGALEATDEISALNEVTEAFLYERGLLERCRDSRMDRVVLALIDGKTNVDGFGPFGLVCYLIFELADGDVRAHIDFAKKIDLAWILRSLHNVTVGLKQLHGRGIAHKDLKPSNVLVFHESISKVADLGRAADSGNAAPHDSMDWSHADRSYAPPELLYGYEDAEWNIRNIGCDAYLLGSMIVFFFTKSSMTSLLLSELDPKHRPQIWTSTFEEVLPYVRDAFGRAIENFASHAPESIRDELRKIVTELCDPDPRLRGTAAALNAGKNFMETYVTRLNVLAYKYPNRISLDQD